MASMLDRAIAAPTPTGDRHYAVGLHLLTLAVLAALTASIALLAWRWATPAPAAAAPVTLTQIGPRSAPVRAADPPAAGGNQLLLAPAQVFRCVKNGRVSYGDRPCGDTH